MRVLLRLAVCAQCGLVGRVHVIVVVLPCFAAHFEIRGGRAANLQYAPQMFLVIRHNRTVEAKINFLICFRSQTKKRRECAVAVCSGLVVWAVEPAAGSHSAEGVLPQASRRHSRGLVRK
jgi:hypothetical protein